MSWVHDHKNADELLDMADMADHLHCLISEAYKQFTKAEEAGLISDEPDTHFDELLAALKAEKEAAEGTTPIDANTRLTAAAE